MPQPAPAGISWGADGVFAPSDVPFFESPPDEVHISRSDHTVELVWPERRLPFDFAELRRHCRCADCTAKRRAGGQVEVADTVDIVAIHPLGASALQFVFSDGHERGIFPWLYLAEIAYWREASGP